MSEPGKWKDGDEALWKPPFGCAMAGQYVRVKLCEGVLFGKLKPHGCKIQNCRVWPRAESSEGPFVKVPECELAVAPSVKVKEDSMEDKPQRWRPVKGGMIVTQEWLGGA